MKELGINEEIRIRCVKDRDGKSCERCQIYNGYECDFPIPCSAKDRSDHEDVHFEFVDALPVSPWHSVEEELPEYQKRYFVRMVDEDGGEHYAYIPYLCDGKWWYPAYLSVYKKLKVTHWMPIPELPKEKED